MVKIKVAYRNEEDKIWTVLFLPGETHPAVSPPEGETWESTQQFLADLNSFLEG